MQQQIFHSPPLLYPPKSIPRVFSFDDEEDSANRSSKSDVNRMVLEDSQPTSPASPFFEAIRLFGDEKKAKTKKIIPRTEHFDYGDTSNKEGLNKPTIPRSQRFDEENSALPKVSTPSSTAKMLSWMHAEPRSEPVKIETFQSPSKPDGSDGSFSYSLEKEIGTASKASTPENRISIDDSMGSTAKSLVDVFDSIVVSHACTEQTL
mmetsp:Transcript_31367/g.76518  ORF Transcript_31367/g.76518 Transcript_31367/m.76518 type:complete len:206 (+) Transcript_31367:89-706(+)